MANNGKNFGLDKVRSIILPKLDPKAYRFWRKQAEATFDIYSCSGIILGIEPQASSTRRSYSHPGHEESVNYMWF